MALRSLVRGAVERVMCALPRRTRPGDRLILAYHNVVPSDWAPRGDRSLHLPVDKFEAQLRMIRNEAKIVPLMELLTTSAPNDRRVAVTFDDAYASALELGVGACIAHCAPCTVFVAPGLLGTVPVWDRAADAGNWTDADRRRFLWEQRGLDEGLPNQKLEAQLAIATLDVIRAVTAGGLVSVGNHTMTHPNLGALSRSEVITEIDSAGEWIRKQLGRSVIPVLAYPYGIPPTGLTDFDQLAAEKWGLLVTGGWFKDDPSGGALSVARWNVPAGVSSLGFRRRLRGWM